MSPATEPYLNVVRVALTQKKVGYSLPDGVWMNGNAHCGIELYFHNRLALIVYPEFMDKHLKLTFHGDAWVKHAGSVRFYSLHTIASSLCQGYSLEFTQDSIKIIAPPPSPPQRGDPKEIVRSYDSLAQQSYSVLVDKKSLANLL